MKKNLRARAKIMKNVANNKKRLNIAMIAAMQYPYTKASCIRVSNIVESYISEFNDVVFRIFSYKGDPVSDSEYIKYYRVEGFNQTKYYSWFNKFKVDYKILLKIILNRKKIDIIHCHTHEGIFISFLFKFITIRKIPVCADIHGPLIPELINNKMIPKNKIIIKLFMLGERILNNLVDLFFVSNSGLVKYLKKNNINKEIIIVHDYVKLDQFGHHSINKYLLKSLKKKYKKSSEKLVMFIGMFKNYQGVDYLLKSFEKVSRKYSNIKLILVGNGRCKNHYDLLIDQLSIKNKVIYTGIVPHILIPNYIKLADILVSPRIENNITKGGFVSQMPEYMALGSLIVSTNISECDSMLSGGAGILVKPNNVNSLARALEIALTLKEPEIKKYKLKSKEKSKEWSWSANINKIRNGYYYVLNARKSKEKLEE